MGMAASTVASARLVRRDAWIVGPYFDVLIVVIPFLVATGALFGFRALGVKEPLWAYLLCFIAFDVAHVWSTIYVTYLDGENFRRRRLLYFVPVPVTLVGAFLLHLWSPTAFWTAISYFAIFHFAKQQYGFIAIYKAKAKERSRFDYHLDKWTLWVGALGPVLLWHATPAGQFDWFDESARFLLQPPPTWTPYVYGVMIVVAVLWVSRQIERAALAGAFNFGKTMWMVGAWVSWFVGLRMADHLLVSAAFLNLFHGLPFLALVWWRCNHKWEGRAEEAKRVGSGLIAWLSQRRRWVFFYGFVFSIALIEEAIWDGMVWGTYLPQALGTSPPTTNALQLSFWVALLSTPQIVHYVLDGFIWKMNEHNADLRSAFGSARPTSNAAAPAPAASTQA